MVLGVVVEPWGDEEGDEEGDSLEAGADEGDVVEP